MDSDTVNESELVEIEVWAMVDSSGDYQVGKDAEDVGSRWSEDFGGDHSTAKRHVKVTIKLPLPRPVELVATLDPEPEAATLRVV